MCSRFSSVVFIHIRRHPWRMLGGCPSVASFSLRCSVLHYLPVAALASPVVPRHTSPHLAALCLFSICLYSICQNSTTKIGEDRHPKISDGVLIGAGATILGNVKIGEGAKIGAGSVVLIDVPPRTTAVGNLGSLVGGKEKHSKHEDVPDELMDYTSFISE
ncbi:hypothetical protein Ahy_A05g023146 [Arachis hypogaea]|uniref:Serine O-acetyltransferase n=1 Tax=Arachis hypogaea TaxID=3818 RepID=A0A445D2H8_ARAHY|nr:hypothetical protein Ahy_A05g023146 [Arachis hypogaea]